MYVRCRVAKHPNTPHATLQQLAWKWDVDVHMVLARNPNTPPDVLAVLALDVAPEVQQMALENLQKRQ